MTTKRLKLTGTLEPDNYGWDNSGRLPVGYVIQPGETSHTELDAGAFTDNHVVYEFDVLDPDGSVYSRIDIGMFLHQGMRYQSMTASTPVKPGARPQVANGGNEGIWIAQQLRTTAPVAGQNIGIYDPQGTTFDGTSLTPPQQGRLIAAFCERDEAHCDFISDGAEGVRARSPIAILAGDHPNNTCDPISHSVDQMDSRSATHSWEFSLSLKYTVEKLWEAQFTAKYGGSVTTKTDFVAKNAMSIRPGYIGYFASTVPVYHHSGKWLIEVRVDGAGAVMSTIEVNGTVDIPDNSETTAATVDAKTDPMTDQERAALKHKCAT